MTSRAWWERRVNFFDVILVGRSLLYVCYIGHLKRNGKIQGRHPFKFWRQQHVKMIVYENVMKSVTN